MVGLLKNELHAIVRYLLMLVLRFCRQLQGMDASILERRVKRLINQAMPVE
jgi:hypothetical protein